MSNDQHHHRHSPSPSHDSHHDDPSNSGLLHAPGLMDSISRAFDGFQDDTQLSSNDVGPTNSGASAEVPTKEATEHRQHDNPLIHGLSKSQQSGEPIGPSHIADHPASPSTSLASSSAPRTQSPATINPVYASPYQFTFHSNVTPLSTFPSQDNQIHLSPDYPHLSTWSVDNTRVAIEPTSSPLPSPHVPTPSSSASYGYPTPPSVHLPPNTRPQEIQGLSTRSVSLKRTRSSSLKEVGSIPIQDRRIVVVEGSDFRSGTEPTAAAGLPIPQYFRPEQQVSIPRPNNAKSEQDLKISRNPSPAQPQLANVGPGPGSESSPPVYPSNEHHGGPIVTAAHQPQNHSYRHLRSTNTPTDSSRDEEERPQKRPKQRTQSSSAIHQVSLHQPKRAATNPSYPKRDTASLRKRHPVMMSGIQSSSPSNDPHPPQLSITANYPISSDGRQAIPSVALPYTGPDQNIGGSNSVGEISHTSSGETGRLNPSPPFTLPMWNAQPVVGADNSRLSSNGLEPSMPTSDTSSMIASQSFEMGPSVPHDTSLFGSESAHSGLAAISQDELSFRLGALSDPSSTHGLDINQLFGGDNLDLQSFPGSGSHDQYGHTSGQLAPFYNTDVDSLSQTSDYLTPPTDYVVSDIQPSDIHPQSTASAYPRRPPIYPQHSQYQHDRHRQATITLSHPDPVLDRLIHDQPQFPSS